MMTILIIIISIIVIMSGRTVEGEPGRPAKTVNLWFTLLNSDALTRTSQSFNTCLLQHTVAKSCFLIFV
jgi:hypothetical protein